MQTNNFSSVVEIFIAFILTPMKIMEFFCHLGGYDKDFYGIFIRKIDSDSLWNVFMMDRLL